MTAQRHVAYPCHTSRITRNAAAARRNTGRTWRRAAFCACAEAAGLLSLTLARRDVPIMLFSRRLLLALPLAILAGRAAVAADPSAAPALIERFYATLLAVMREAKKLSFDERYKRLAPTIEQAFDLGLMTRIAIGPGWAGLAPNQQQRLSAAFARYIISNYANRFDDYGGERFEVSPKAVPNPNGIIVESRLIKSNGEPVNLN